MARGGTCFLHSGQGTSIACALWTGFDEPHSKHQYRPVAASFIRLEWVTSFPQTQQSFCFSPGRAPVSLRSAVAMAVADEEPVLAQVQARFPATVIPTVPPQRGQMMAVGMCAPLPRAVLARNESRVAQPSPMDGAYPDKNRPKFQGQI